MDPRFVFYRPNYEGQGRSWRDGLGIGRAAGLAILYIGPFAVGFDWQPRIRVQR